MSIGDGYRSIHMCTFQVSINTMKILKGDTVKILIGKDKGREGLVVKSIPKKSQIVVKGMNIYKKHIKPSQGKPGSIVERERAMTVSKVALSRLSIIKISPLPQI